MSLAMKARQKVKKKTVKDKVFGCDLVEHLQLSGQEVPQVLKSCTEFVEEHGIVDGIYRLCGISSNVQKLRQEFDLERPPDLNKSLYLQDVHCVSSLCKAYFRELPNPLLTYQLYDKFADAVAIQLEEQRLIKIRDVLKELPLPHYRTLEYLMKHLIHVASFSAQTNMHARNLAIVWAPNLLRSRDIESSGFNGTAAFMEVRVQSIVVEFILTHVEQLFGSGSADGNVNSTSATMNLPTCVPDDYYRSLSYNLPSMLNHGDGPPQIRPYHTIIELSDQKRKGSLKAKKWKSIFNLGRSNNDSKRKSTKQDDKDEKSDKMSLRPAKSMDSLSSVPYTADANDLEQRGLTRKSAKHHVPIRRESLGAASKKEDTGYECSDVGKQVQTVETNNEDYEEEAQAKSEPTTPKPGRASMVAPTQGRSPKTNRNRAEKCVGVHISGPFSVTLPFHITSNLSRLTRGMECPSLSYSILHRSSERLFSPEGQLNMGSSDTDKVRLTMVCHIDKENSERIESAVKEVHEQKTETKRISLEVQDTFSFLDSQDTNPDETKTVCKATEKIMEYSADSEMLQYDLQNNVQIKEFSVEPPQDETCTEDEADQMYFTPDGCLDRDDPLGDWHDSLEDVYLSAYDDLSPLSEESNDHLELNEEMIEHGENGRTKEPSDSEGMKDNTSEKPPTTTTDGQTEAQCDAQNPFNQPVVVDESNDRAEQNQCSLQGAPSDEFTSEVTCSTEESDCCTEKDETASDHEEESGKVTAENCNSGAASPAENLENKDSVEDKGQVEMSVPLNPQEDAICRNDNVLDLEAMILNLCSADVATPKYEDRDIPMADEFKNEDLDSPEKPDLYNQEALLMIKATVMNADLPEVQEDCQHDNKNLESPKHSAKDDILLKEIIESYSETVRPVLECAEDIVEDTMTKKTPENKEASKLCPSDTPLHGNPHLTADNTINTTENISLPEILLLLNCLEPTERQLQENTVSLWEEHNFITENQVRDTESSHSDSCSPFEMKQDDVLSVTVTMTPQIDNRGPCTEENRAGELMLRNSQSCSSEEQEHSDTTTFPARPEKTGTSSINPDGSVTMKLAFTPNKIQQVKSVPVVPPKPQFVKLPLALKSKLHASSLLSTTRDTAKSPKPDKANVSEPRESESDCNSKRRSSWRHATSVSFDTAMALAKERQQPQNRVRRMQTYCVGDSYDLIDFKAENTTNFPKFTIKPASSRAHRPLSCTSLSSAEAEFRGNKFLRENPTTLSLQGDPPLFQQETEAYSKEPPQRKRLSMPRIGGHSTDDVHIHVTYHQRRSLL